MGPQTDEEKLARIAANLRRENKIEEQKIGEKIRAAHEEVRRLAAQFLEIDPGIETIVFFGSLAEDNAFSIHFDIDLAVRSEKYLQLVGCGLKSSFLRISKFFENSLDPLSWNRDVIEHMRLDIDGVRPALLDRELAAGSTNCVHFGMYFETSTKPSWIPNGLSLYSSNSILQ